MATRTPIVQASGELQQLQLGDPVSPPAVAVLRVLDNSYVMPANTSLMFVDSLTLNSNASLTIPSTSVALITTSGDGNYWDAIVSVNANNFTTTSASLVNITGLTYAAAANHLYEIEVVLRYQNSGTNAIQFAHAFSGAGATGTVLTMGNTSAVASSGTAAQMSALGTANGTSFGLVATTNFMIFMKGIVVTGANTGNITIQTLIQTSGTVTIYSGSVMKVRKLA
jgi:hypothetical protein